MKIGQTLYFDHQATTPVDARVLAEMEPFQSERFGNPHSADHALGWESANAVAVAAKRIADLIGADADEIVFTSGATEANNLALLGTALASKGGRRNRILVGATEHKSVLAPARFLKENFDYTVDTIPVNQDGTINTCALESIIEEDVALISTILVNNEIGSINIVDKISEICNRFGVLLHCDAAQAAEAIDLGQVSQHVDLLSLSSHKVYGPKGIGVLYVRRDLQGKVHPIIHGGGQQGYLRSGTLPTPLCVGMGKAVEIILNTSGEDERLRIRTLRDDFVLELFKLDWPMQLNGPSLADRHPGNANIRFEGFSAHDILGALQPHLAASTGSACTSGIPEPSHVLTAIGLSREEADASIRFSLGRQTTEQDVENAIGLVQETLDRLSSI